MKEHLLTVFLAITTAITIFTVAWIERPRDIAVFDFYDIVFEQQTMHGNLMITSDAYNELTLSFLNRKIAGQEITATAYATGNDAISFMALISNENVPFTTFALVSRDSSIHEMIVVETGFPIAHQTLAKTDATEGQDVFMVSSSDFTGGDVLIFGLDEDGNIIVEIEIE